MDRCLAAGANRHCAPKARQITGVWEGGYAMPNAEMKKVQADSAKIGAIMQERWILVGTDL
jgi:hypothetical protein